VVFTKKTGEIADDLRKREVEAKLETSKTKEALTKTEADLKAKQDALAKAEDESKKVQQQLAEAVAKGTTLQTEVDALKKKIADMPVQDPKQLADLQAKIVAAEQARDEALKQIKEKADQAKALQDQLNALQGENKLLADKGKELESKLKVARGEPGWERPLPEGLSAKVLFYDKTWNFVVVDAGKKKGAIENGVLLVHRGTEMLGPARITTVDDDACIADYMGDFKKKEPKPGDTAIPKR
jgi:hypothetical protein